MMLLPGTRRMPRGVGVTHATLRGSGSMLPQDFFFKLGPLRWILMDFGRCYYIHVYLKSKFLGRGEFELGGYPPFPPRCMKP